MPSESYVGNIDLSLDPANNEQDHIEADETLKIQTASNRDCTFVVRV